MPEEDARERALAGRENQGGRNPAAARTVIRKLDDRCAVPLLGMLLADVEKSVAVVIELAHQIFEARR